MSCKNKVRSWMWLLWIESWGRRHCNPRKCQDQPCYVPASISLPRLCRSLFPYIQVGEKQDPQRGWRKGRGGQAEPEMISRASATWDKVVLDANQTAPLTFTWKHRLAAPPKTLRWLWLGHRALAIFNQAFSCGLSAITNCLKYL